MDDRPNIILSPHFDDAVLSLGGLIGKNSERAIVVTVFTGIPSETMTKWWDRWSGFGTTAEAMRARCAENEAALALLGVPPSQIINLGHLDNQYRTRQRLDGIEPGELRSAITDDIRQIIDRHDGQVKLFAPAMAWHPDHRIVAEAAVALCRSGDCADTEFLLYQDQPYAYLNFRKTSLAPLKFAGFARLNGQVPHRLGLTVERQFIDLEDNDIDRKQQSIRRYQSQFRGIMPLLIKLITDFSYYQAREAGLASRYAEVVYRLGAPHS